MLSNSTAFGKASFPIKDTPYETSSTNCVSYWQETAWYYDPDGDADPCDCSGNETYEYSTYNVVTVCSQIGTSTDQWWAGQGVASGPSGGSGIPTYNPNYPFDNPNNPFNAPEEPIIANGITVEDYIFPQGNYPSRKIAETVARRTPGSTAEDLQFGYNGDNAGISDEVKLLSDNEQFNHMDNLIDRFTVYNSALNSVGDAMVQRFRNRTGGSFRNLTLSNEVSKSSQTFNFLKLFGEELNTKLIAAGGNIANVTPFTVNYRPIYNGLYNKFHGLQILVNDTEHTDVQLDDFYMSSSGNWTAYITLTITDHFGLDKNDAIQYQSYHLGFPSWWILQHLKGYKPFKTIITVRKVIKGKL